MFAPSELRETDLQEVGKGKVICMHASFFLPTFFPPRQLDRQVPTGNSQIRFFLLGVFNFSRQNQPGYMYLPLFFFAHFNWYHHSNAGEPKGLVMLESIYSKEITHDMHNDYCLL